MTDEQQGASGKVTDIDESIDLGLKVAYAALRDQLVEADFEEDHPVFSKLAAMGGEINRMRERNAALGEEQANALASAYTEGGAEWAKVQGERDAAVLRCGVYRAIYFPVGDPIIQEVELEGMNVLSPGEVMVRKPDAEHSVAVFRMVSGEPVMDRLRSDEVSASLRAGANPRAHRTAGQDRNKIGVDDEPE